MPFTGNQDILERIYTMGGSENNEVELRKAQENVANMIAGGFHKDIAKMAKAMYDAYVEAGFNKEQAIELTKMSLSGGAR